jgi:hypothetical protein
VEYRADGVFCHKGAARIAVRRPINHEVCLAVPAGSGDFPRTGEWNRLAAPFTRRNAGAELSYSRRTARKECSLPRIPRTEVTPLDRADLIDLLELFEREWTDATGEDLPSDDFYTEYRAGAHDTPFAMAWATFYEAFVRLSEPRRRELDALFGPALPAVPA